MVSLALSMAVLLIGYLVYAFMHPDIRDGEYDDE